MLLALGLNVVVGWGGLFDLGYIAFYGIGAYAYAMLSSSQFDIHLPSIVSIPLIVIGGALIGLLVGLPSWTARRGLPRDRDAVLLPAVHHGHDERGRPVRAQRHRRLERHRRCRRCGRPAQLLRLGAAADQGERLLQPRLHLRRVGRVRSRVRRPALRQPLAHGSRLALAPRRRAGRRDDGHAGQLAEADGVLVRRGRGGAHRNDLRLAQRRASSRRPSSSRC